MSRRRAIVVAGHPATADAGAAVLRAGGNAVDAALAAVTTSFCAEPVLTSAGGGGFMLIADAGKAVLYDGFARMPSTPTSLSSSSAPGLQAIPVDFGDCIQNFHIGAASVGTPSLLAMLFAAHRQHGKMPLHDALAPGIDAARSGVSLNPLQASFLQLLEPILTSKEHCNAIHAPAGALLTAGERFQNRDLANTLEMLSHEGIEEMYHGDLARHIVSACMPHGLLSMDDMRAEQVIIRAPLSTPLFAGTLLSNPPPSSGGLLISLAASLLQQLMLLDESKTTPWPVLMSEVLRIASRVRHDDSLSPGLDQRIHETAIASDILAPQRIKQHLKHILQRLRNHSNEAQYEASNRHGSTTHISIVDKTGMAVSLTSSNGEGSGIVVPGTGIHLNNMLGEEDINPLGLHALSAGFTLPSMMAPSIYMKHGKPAVVLGSGGSNRLRGAILQVLTRHLMLGQTIEEAVHAPRLHNEGNRLDIEPDFLSEHDKHLAMQMGWQLNPWQQQSVYFGGVNAISCDSNGDLHGCADPRRGGAVAYA